MPARMTTRSGGRGARVASVGRLIGVDRGIELATMPHRQHDGTGYPLAAEQERLEALAFPSAIANYEIAAEQERMLGYRHPGPYEAARAEFRQQPCQGHAPSRHLYNSRHIAGQRSVCGAFGAPGPADDRFYEPRSGVSLRHGMGRDPGIWWEADQAEGQFQVSGVLGPTGAQSFSSFVRRDRPNLVLMSNAGMVRLRVTAGHAQGGFRATRTFVLGNGYTTALALADYTNVKVVLEEAEALGTVVRFVWSSQDVTGGNRDLYLPRAVTNAVTANVPEGAYAVVLPANDAGWVWRNTVSDDPKDPSIFPVTIAGNTRSDVLGATYTPTITQDSMWILRPF